MRTAGQTTLHAVSRRGRAGIGQRWHLQDAAIIGPFLLMYLTLEWVSSIHEFKGMPVTPWNPGLGVVFALMVRKGAQYGVVLFAGVVIAEILVLDTEVAPLTILAIAVVVSASYAGAASFARARLWPEIGLARVRDAMVLLGAGIAGAAVTAALLSLLLTMTGELEVADLTSSAIPLFVGDVIGIAVMTPLFLRLWSRWGQIFHQRMRALVPELALYALVTVLALSLIVGSDSQGGNKFFSLLFVPVVAAAVRHGIDGSCLALAATQLALVAVLHSHGYSATAFTEFQVIMFVLTTTGLLVGIVVSEREQAALAARNAEAKLKALQIEAARVARLNLLSGMASALAHEINQPMTAARALARSAQQILRGKTVDLERADTNLAALVGQIDHAGGVVRRMREFMRRGEPHTSTLDVKALLEGALVLARPEAASHQIRIDLDVAEPLPAVFGDGIQLQQVVLNLVHNGMEAIVEAQRKDGHVWVGARLAQPGELEVSIRDNGVGVPPGLPLFEPLSSSKSDGLGLGLMICASIIQAHGGRIWLQSSEAGATEFRVVLPVPHSGTR